VSRAKARFGFTAGTPFSLGIAQTVKYYEAHQGEIDAGTVPAAPLRAESREDARTDG
jgi:hypothetical protein